jgi:hypothetical protein
LNNLKSKIIFIFNINRGIFLCPDHAPGVQVAGHELANTHLFRVTAAAEKGRKSQLKSCAEEGTMGWNAAFTEGAGEAASEETAWGRESLGPWSWATRGWSSGSRE